MSDNFVDDEFHYDFEPTHATTLITYLREKNLATQGTTNDQDSHTQCLGFNFCKCIG
jgi:hypothetical protein